MNTKIRTTVYLPQELVEAVKLEALSRGMTLTGMVEEGLKEQIKSRRTKRRKLVLKTYDLGNPKYVFKRTDAYE
ncbi:hypothetical protein A3H89_00470 [Candidatus Amesbacteria bacterium RIFCSPLOWO2_02_FULL_48_11]|uniref:Ribbon-helix-helix protein CopG domain-containing protein n=5 Tax=Candidatus Amesiibacteriota TaxID=1752730 RepID=A0A1F4Z8F5_9BACT|nr:MAG: hypothetical protein UX78_C0005G0058 [Candidatus Amesbacteria bacterium GW2011_GWA2_47_11]KKU93764.1 MAG: hypothetical protein UY22_C0017G0021 [Candidatus Amesbacteria bacterium GW2011_GWC1_48_10]KKU99558.1 MAG: hypothetical protein UY33_C0028G0012 [Candidatus Amesbacteria bacterium GW2011_GWA1_48_9]OGC90008.1 MAG: hypothetical protein A2V48_01210 [Candidatus Amesbacteria bacterium RBG_19FT_COMBO_48_16]OGC96215.1 MAG: hypothetical protein A3C34_02420 [Candidatus Amesbacteria bacterium R